MTTPTPVNDLAEQRRAFYDEIRPYNMAPLWEVLHGLVIPEPKSPAAPAKWSYDTARDCLLRAGDLITAEEAERRVLVLENPAMTGQSCITRTLYAGLQLILPGESAPVHRHSQSALRFVMEGSGAFTSVGGERAYMEPFDLVLTPSLHWHGHGNDTSEPMIWLDGLDIPLVRALDASFAEGMRGTAGEEAARERRPPGDNIVRYGSNLRPVSGTTADVNPSTQPLFHYRYADWSESLARAAASSDPDPHFGIKLEFLNPATAGPVMNTISAFAQQIPAGFRTRPVQDTAGQIHVVCGGSGQAEVGDERFELSLRDVFVVPAWTPLSLAAEEDLVLFSFSDQVVQRQLGLWREPRH